MVNMKNRMDDSLWTNDSSLIIITEFNLENIDYLIIGGCAVAWYWIDRPLAEDLDLMVNPEKINSHKLFKCLKSHINNFEFSENYFSKNAKLLSLKEKKSIS